MKTKVLTIVQVLGFGLLLAGCGADTNNKMKMVGPVDIDGDGKTDGTGYDRDGDGKVDAIDVDGDGELDGHDYDGDGNITVWDDLDGNGAVEPSEAMTELHLDEIDPDLIDNVDPNNQPPGMSGGEVTIKKSVLLPANLTLTPKSQGQQGSCAAWTNAALATLVRAKREQVDPNTIWASPGFLYERQIKETKVMCNGGTYIHTGLNALVREGSATLAEVPYRAEDDALACEVGSKAASGHLYRIGSWSAMTPFTRAKIKETLSAGKQIAFGISLPVGFNDWHGEQASGVFSGTGTCTGTQHCGGHAMLLVGYDDDKGAYRIQNSWGTDWGDKGFIWWKYEDFDARKPYGYSVTELPPAAVTAFTEPSPTTFDLKVIGVATYSIPVDGGKEWYVNVRVQASEPFQATKSVLTNSTSVFENPLDAWLTYGDVNFYAGSNAAPPQEMTMTHLEGTLRNGMKIMKDFTVLVPAPAAMGD